MMLMLSWRMFAVVKGNFAAKPSCTHLLSLHITPLIFLSLPPLTPSLSVSIFCRSKTERRQIYTSPLHAGMSAASFWCFLERPVVWGRGECLTRRGWRDDTSPALRVAASSLLTQKSRALHQAQSFVYIKTRSLRAAAGCQADSRPHTPYPKPHTNHTTLNVIFIYWSICQLFSQSVFRSMNDKR